jgi:hypothetical protein
MNRNDDDVMAASVAYIDELFGPGAGVKHAAFLNRIENDALREMLHRYHALESDTQQLSVAENYLIGVAVLCATKSYGTAAMFAKTLLHLGVHRDKILTTIARLSMWVGGLHAVEATLHIQKAIAEYEAKGLASLDAWFPDSPGTAK